MLWCLCKSICSFVFAVGLQLITGTNEVAFHTVLLKLFMQIQHKLHCDSNHLQHIAGKHKHYWSFSSASIASARFSLLYPAVRAPGVYSSAPADPQALPAHSTEEQEGLPLEEPLILFCFGLFCCCFFFKPLWKNTCTVSLQDHSPVLLWNCFIEGSQRTINCTAERKNSMHPHFRYPCKGFSARVFS